VIVPYYPCFSYLQRPFEMRPQTLKLLDQAVTIPSPTVDAIGAAARAADMVVSIGVNERAGGSLYNTQLLFDADGTLIQRRRKTTPTYHERMIRGQGDGSELRAVDSAVGRIGQLACWEHYNPLARYALIADGEQIHSSMFPGSFGGDLFAQHTEISARNHALESGASSSTRPPGSTPISSRRSWPTRVVRSARSLADSSPRSSVPRASTWASRCGPARARWSPTSTSR
jgi:aliphatic nitrilase